ncbi:MAG: hypothetical protein FWH15_01520 [Betaproteobacteria bacterium]|nr:hypothetical protein [Betaproteobacteria bacterium]
MNQNIYNSWRDFRTSFAEVLVQASSEVCIFDDDLDKTGLAETANIETLRSLLVDNPRASVRIALRDTRMLSQKHPRLLRLMRAYSHTMKIQEVSATFVPRRDCMILADGCHLVVRFDLEHPRCKLVLDDANEVQSYANLFSEIWAAPSKSFSPEMTGLR